jgi:hypothetical protein
VAAVRAARISASSDSRASGQSCRGYRYGERRPPSNAVLSQRRKIAVPRAEGPAVMDDSLESSLLIMDESLENTLLVLQIADEENKRATENLRAAVDAKRLAEAGLQDAIDRVRAATMRDWIIISARLNEQREGRR